MKPIVIFGIGKISEVMHYFFENHSEREIKAFTIDDEFLNSETKYQKPVVKFSQLENLYPPSEFDVFIALGYQRMNKVREDIYKRVEKKGYKLISFIHPESGIPKDCKVGKNCMIMNNVNIHPKVIIGNNVFVWSGSVIGHHSKIEDNCWLTSSSNISGNVKIGRNCFFAINSTVTHSVTIGKECFIGANVLISKCTKDLEVYIFERTKPFRLNSKQFIRMTNFDII